MNKAQYLVVGAALALFAGLYWGFDTTPPSQKKLERSRALQGESTGFETLLAAAKSTLRPEQTAAVRAAEEKLSAAASDTERVGQLKNLSGLWYDFGQVPAAAGFAEQAAQVENSDSAWSVAGALFYAALVASQDPTLRDYCASHAVKAFESATSLNPGRVEHRVNLALVYAESPPPDDQMQAVKMLRALEQQHPDEASVYNALGRLAIKTGQWPRAIERLEKARTLDPKNPLTPCLLAKAYQGAGQADKAAEFAKICQ